MKVMASTPTWEYTLTKLDDQTVELRKQDPVNNKAPEVQRLSIEEANRLLFHLSGYIDHIEF